MSISIADLSNLKWSLGAFALSLALGGVLVFLSDGYLARSLKERQSAQKQLADAHAQLAAAQSDQENMSTYAMEYNTLASQGIIGSEQRLDWLEGLEQLRQQGSVLDLKYTITPQQSYTPVPAADAGNFQLSRSNMTLQLDLLHEEQLLRLFAGMRKQMKGWFMLDGCTLSRTGAANEIAPLKAECTGGWVTMKDKSTP